ncbi:hypothetical protein CPB84DRAFT_1899641 [Gymnopilus junonius]|uniref:Uncharacterized protein n=1 Tax=Gymnopilus junonius TaxID=109634 RepID=A0A9P5N8E6_GYMJU|nr:hypothetical protein CPB84DRAFT_1899641 [Gymnopilus junonius]
MSPDHPFAEYEYSFTRSLNYGSQLGLMWNFALDGNDNPKLFGTNSCGGPGSRPLVTVNSNRSYSYNQEFYAMASKAIIPKDPSSPFRQRISMMVQDSLSWALIVRSLYGRDGPKLRGMKEAYAPVVYQMLVSSILLCLHPTELTATLLAATSHVWVQVKQTWLEELLKWIGKCWLVIHQEKGFDPLEGWALKEISGHKYNIEVPLKTCLACLYTLLIAALGHPHHLHLPIDHEEEDEYGDRESWDVTIEDGDGDKDSLAGGDYGDEEDKSNMGDDRSVEDPNLTCWGWIVVYFNSQLQFNFEEHYAICQIPDPNDIDVQDKVDFEQHCFSSSHGSMRSRVTTATSTNQTGPSITSRPSSHLSTLVTDRMEMTTSFKIHSSGLFMPVNQRSRKTRQCANGSRPVQGSGMMRVGVGSGISRSMEVWADLSGSMARKGAGWIGHQRLDGGSYSFTMGTGGAYGSAYGMYGMGKGLLKREGDQLRISSERMKRMHSVSPAVSDMSRMETHGLFVRPQQVLYVVDAVGLDL